MKTKLIVFTLFLLTAGVVASCPPLATPVAAQAKPAVAAASAIATSKPKIDVVFVLDTTGSMSGLIDAAKENIWAIASSMAKAQPTPEIRVGLVAFRDRGDDYVTRVVNLSPDLDSVYASLMDFQAAGGGDTPESVNQALFDAVHQMPWSQSKDAYQVIFLVGDAPPQMDYPDDVKYPATIAAAAAKGIVVNTILAGNDLTTEGEWKRIAALNQGKYFKVGQAGDAIAVATPYDAELAKLARALDDTRMYYGDETARAIGARKEAATLKLHADSSIASQAKRAMFNSSEGGKTNMLGDNELVDAVSSGRVDLSTITKEDLPEALRGLDRDEQKDTIQQAAEERSRLSAKIRSLSEERQGYIARELVKQDKTEQSLDTQIFDAVKEQASKKGLTYESAPVY